MSLPLPGLSLYFNIFISLVWFSFICQRVISYDSCGMIKFWSHMIMWCDIMTCWYRGNFNVSPDIMEVGHRHRTMEHSNSDSDKGPHEEEDIARNITLGIPATSRGIFRLSASSLSLSVSVSLFISTLSCICVSFYYFLQSLRELAWLWWTGHTSNGVPERAFDTMEYKRSCKFQTITLPKLQLKSSKPSNPCLTWKKGHKTEMMKQECNYGIVKVSQ